VEKQLSIGKGNGEGYQLEKKGIEYLLNFDVAIEQKRGESEIFYQGGGGGRGKER